MSLKKKAEALKGLISAPDANGVKSVAGKADVVSDQPAAPSEPKTAPGMMLAFRRDLAAHKATVTELKAKLDQYKDSFLTLKLDPTLVDDSKWANRHQSSFASQAFDQLKDEIAHAGGNVQPILVRPGEAGKYEIVFGHRRARACRDLSIPVLAMIIDMSDEELFTLMDRENRLRENLTPFEQGDMWKKALDEGLFPSATKLASHLGVSKTLVTQCVDIARLPESVIAAFPAPTEIQMRWGQQLKELLQSDPEVVLERAEKIKLAGVRLSASKVFALLSGVDEQAKRATTTPIKRDGKVIGKLVKGDEGEISFSLKAGALPQKKVDAIIDQLQKLIED